MGNQNIATQVDPFDPSRFAANSTVVGDIGVTREFVTCPVRKPNKKEFVRVHPELKLSAHILELDIERETYLVEPAVAEVLAGDVRSVSLHLTASRQSSIFLWPVPLPPLDGRDNSWNHSARVAARLAESKWVRVVSRMDQQAYEVLSAPGNLGSPIWPDVGMREILMVAFGESFVIRDAGHPVVKRLLGQA
jgi:hypothetical protein